MTTILPPDWSVYEKPELWPQSPGRVFLAEAVRQLGYLLEFWEGEEPRWANSPPYPPFPGEAAAFDGDRPIEQWHAKFAHVVRGVLSPAAFQRQQLAPRVEEDPSSDNMPVVDFDEEAFEKAYARELAGDDAEDPVTRDHWAFVSWEADSRQSRYKAAEERLPTVAAKLLGLAQSEDLPTFSRPVEGGNVEPLPVQLWEVRNALPRMASCGLNIDDPMNPTASVTHHIFVDREALNRIVRGAAPRLDAGIPPSRPHMSVSAHEKLLDDAMTWLLDKVEATINQRWWTKELYHQALLDQPEFTDLSDSDWEKVWGPVTRIYTEVARKGRRPNPPPGA